jgi:hypothetical protein
MEAQIKGFEGYSVTDKGEVLSYKGTQRKVLRQHLVGTKPYNYYAVKLRRNGKAYNKRVNRLIYFAFNPLANPELEVHHKNNIATDNRLTNLDLVSKSQNCFLRQRQNKKSKYGENIERGRWGNYRVSVRFEGIRHNKSFIKLTDAKKYRDALKKKLFTDSCAYQQKVLAMLR